MSEKKLYTKYAPAERASKEILERQISLFQNNEVLNLFLGKIPSIFLIVNPFRQIVYMNKGALEFTGLNDVASAIGKRPGELIGCIHSTEEPGGCGTAESCTYCSAVNAVLESQKGKLAINDCRLVLGNKYKAFDLRIWASPLKVNGEFFTAITLQDIRNEKWRSFLERIFFHDIINTATGLQGTIELLAEYRDKLNEQELIKRAERITKNLIEEIRSQQFLIMAENNFLKLTLSHINSMDLLNEIKEFYEKQELTQGKEIEIAPDSVAIEIISDRTLLRRILGNMMKNAIEATSKNGKITIGCVLIGVSIRFWVHNPGFISRDIQLQIFNRSFSTKGQDRGLGTYSMKLLSSFLEGDVSFTTSEEEGTIFYAEYPIKVKET
jgi:signal transduction histidine kinase